MCVKSECVHSLFIYLLHFKLFRYFKIILFWHFLLLCCVALQLLSYQGVSEIYTFRS